MTVVPVLLPCGLDRTTLATLLAAVPVAAVLLEPGSLALAAGNAPAAALLDAAPGGLTTAWQKALLAWPELRRRLAAVTSRLAPEAFKVAMDQPGRPPRQVLVQARHVGIEGRALLSAALVDITRHRRARTAPAATRASRLRALFEANPIAVHRSHADGRVLDANAAFLRIIGASRAALEAGSLRWDRLTAPEWVASDLVARDAALANGYCVPYEKEYLLPDGRRVPVLVGFAVLDGVGREFAAFVLDLTAQKQAEAGRAASEREARRRLADLEALYRTTPLGLGQMDRDLRFVRINEALAEMNGASVDAHIGRSVWDLVPDLREAAEPFLRQVLATGQPVVGLEFSGETPRQPGRRCDWVEHLHPVRDPETQEVVGVGVGCEELTERRQAERARELLLRELDHRVKNLFAVIGGLVSFTARTAASPETMRKTLLGRIGALARAHDLVRPALVGAVVDRAAGPTLVQLLEALMEPFRAGFGQPERLRLAGPPVLLGQTGAPPLALALHEMATNAAKHGALANDAGRISIDWTVLPAEAGAIPGPLAGGEPLGPSLLLRWQERGGPAVGGPSLAGFGQRLITQSCAQLGGTARLDWEAAGLAAELLLPLQRLAR